MIDSIDSSQISRDNLNLAKKQLWEKLLPFLNYLSKEDIDLVELAFIQMVDAHGEMRRKSGEFYIIHPVAACIILSRIRLYKDALMGCLLHDVPEDTDVSLEDLSKVFDPEIIFLVEGVTKFSQIKYKGEHRYAENLRKMFVAMSKDIRIIFIKLADRIHNLSTLEHVRPDKQRRIALESMEIYAPIAERLGMSKFRGIIEDLSFPYVYPEEFKELQKRTELELERRNAVCNLELKKISKALEKSKIKYDTIKGRAKRYYSIFLKTNEKGKTLENIYDLIAMRIITFSVDYCYQILSELHQVYEPIEGRVKDYITKPKENGYQSVHTTVRDADTGEIFEIQIRTREMDRYAEYGIATHWAYKDNIDSKGGLGFNPEKFKWISEIVDLGKQNIGERDYLRKVKINLYHDRIFVMTPKGDVVDLRAGATALDFAFKIHEDIGRRAVLAKINGGSAKLEDKLKNGDVVEIVTNKKQNPTIDWINRVKSNTSMNKIRRIIRRNNE